MIEKIYDEKKNRKKTLSSSNWDPLTIKKARIIIRHSYLHTAYKIELKATE